MTPASPSYTADTLPAADPDDATGLPWLRTWGRVYLFVLVVFIAYVLAMLALSRVFA